MEAFREIQEKLDELERLKSARSQAVKRHYRKWIKQEGDLSEEEKKIANDRIKRRREYQADYYEQNKERAKQYSKERYEIKRQTREALKAQKEKQEKKVEKPKKVDPYDGLEEVELSITE
jgi:hypothetical protein